MPPISISVLLPTRKRTTLVQRSVESLFALSASPEQIEVVLAYDEDDAESDQYFNSPDWQSLVTSWRGHLQLLRCPPWGYWQLNRYYNFAASRAQGSWLVVWNDDAVMKTSNWDQQVVANQGFVGMLHMTTENFKPNLTLFPIVPRIWLDLFGEISHTQITDTWIQEICHEADAVRSIPVSVFHDRFDVTGNNLDQTYLDRRYNKKDFNHENMKRLRSEWAHRLKQYREHGDACDAKPHQT